MKAAFVLLGFVGATIGCVNAQAQPVLVAGGGSPYAYTPGVVAPPATESVVPGQPTYVVAQTPVVYATPVVPVPVYGGNCGTRGYQAVSGGYYSPPNVVYFGGPNSCYNSSYPGPYYQPGCQYYSPSVIYFGRGEAWERGYAFRHPR